MNVHPNPKRHAAQPIADKPATTALSPEMAAKQLMQRFELAFSTRDVDGVIACVAPGFEWRLPDGQVFAGRRDVRRVLQARFGMTDGPRFSKSRFRYYGNTVVQTYRVSVPDGNGGFVPLRGCDVYKIRRGLLVRKDAYWKRGPQRAGQTA